MCEKKFWLSLYIYYVYPKNMWNIFLLSLHCTVKFAKFDDTFHCRWNCYLGWTFSGLLVDGWGECPPLPRVCHTYISYKNETWDNYTLPKKDRIPVTRPTYSPVNFTREHVGQNIFLHFSNLLVNILARSLVKMLAKALVKMFAKSLANKLPKAL